MARMPRVVVRAVLALALAAAAGAAAACGEGGNMLAPLPDGGLTIRHRAKPIGVRAYPPHAIRADGVGPYLVGEPLSDVLHDLPEGPRVELLQIGSLLNWKIVRAGGDAMLIGADENVPSRVAFLVVLDAEIARTENGMGVGRTGAELIKAFGPERPQGVVVYETRVFEFDKLPNVRFVTLAAPETAPALARVAAVVVARPGPASAPTGEPPPPPDAGPRTPGSADGGVAAPVGCAGPELSVTSAEIVAAARSRVATPGNLLAMPAVRHGCVTGVPDAVALLPGGELVVVTGEPGKLRRVASAAVDGVDFLALSDLDHDGHDEIILAAHRRERRESTVSLRVLRWDGVRLVLALDERVFSVSEASAAAAGLTPDRVNLLLEIAPARGGLTVAGLFWASTFTGVRMVAPVDPVTLRVAAPRPPLPDDPGATLAADDAGARAPARDAGPGSSSSGGGGRPQRGDARNQGNDAP